MHIYIRYTTIFFFLLLATTSCFDNKNFLEKDDAHLEFSSDTVSFDTVFTQTGSVTKSFKIYNPYDSPLQIQSIQLAGNTDFFQLNINGEPTRGKKNVEILSKDSLYIFVQVKVDPTNRSNPVTVKDSIVFNTNGNVQDIKLVAYGQDVHILKNELISSDTSFTDEKPFLVKNFMMVDTNRTLTIQEGAHLHFTKHSRLIVRGSLEVNGSRENPVIFQGRRLEWAYRDVPSQWQGIWMPKNSGNHEIDNAIIKNAVLGIRLGSIANRENPRLTLTNSVIKHMSYAGIYAQTSSIFAANNLFYDCGNYAIALTLGGSYEFYHTTIGNYWSSRAGHPVRNTPSVILNNYYRDTANNLHYYDLRKAYFGNSIIYGNNSREIGIEKKGEEPVFNYQFENNLLKINTEEVDTGNQHFTSNIVNPGDFSFKDPHEPEFNYHLDTLSPAKDTGSIEITKKYPEILTTDIEGNNRLEDQAPDLGAYERVDTTKE